MCVCGCHGSGERGREPREECHAGAGLLGQEDLQRDQDPAALTTQRPTPRLLQVWVCPCMSVRLSEPAMIIFEELIMTDKVIN